MFALWVDGRLEASRTDLDWHGVWNDYAINAVFLENYWNQGSGKRQARWFDDFVISTQPIGPLIAANPPSITRTPGSGLAAWEAQAATDPQRKDVVWRSKTLASAARGLVIDAAHGTFMGSRAGKRQLTAGATHWLRLRERNASGVWSDWTTWHAPLRTAP